ncbi:MAG: hypothetical protein H6Q69_2953 [Firmicutes bacterium]|nr:hypothetical protein [Bacillota bacterium]
MSKQQKSAIEIAILEADTKQQKNIVTEDMVKTLFSTSDSLWLSKISWK